MTALIIHGGAGRIREEDRNAYQRGLERALQAGYAQLAAGATALEAVLAVVVSMEDNPDAFNAGFGSSLTALGEVECDAAVMTGWDKAAGAVGAVKTIKNPVLAANNVRVRSPHVLVVGEGAAAFAEATVANHELIAPRQFQRWQAWRAKCEGPTGSATVGAVALDAEGRLATATSTGGMTGKLPGRVGDSPIIGAGTYADTRVGVSCTGHGESFMRGVTANTLARLLEAGMGLGDAASSVLAEVAGFGGDGGLIALTVEGQICAAFNAPNMAYAWRRGDEQQVQVSQAPGVTLF